MAKIILFLLVALSNIGVISLSVGIVVYLNGKRMFGDDYKCSTTS